MDHIFDNVGVDAREALKLVVPISASAGVFPVASGQKGGLRLDDTLGNMFYSDGTNWRQVGSVLSVGLSASGALAVSGSPVTTSGVINLNWTGTAAQYVRGDGSLATFPSIPSITPSALTKTNDTNVTLTLGGTPGTALLQNVSLTLGWNGVLAISRGGTGLGTLGTANQLLRVNSSATALEYFTPDWTSNTGTVTSFSAGNLSPLFTTGVATPTTTPALSFNLSNCNQYQVFGRVVAGTGAPSYVSLNPIAFNGLAIPNREVVFGTGTGVSSSSGFKYTTLESVQIGTGTATGTYSFQMGAGSVASNYTMNIGGGIVNNIGNYSLIISESGSEISGIGNAALSVILGGNANKIIAGSDAYSNVIIGQSNTITSTKTTTYNRILGRSNTITDALRCNILGESNNITASGAYTGYDNNIIGSANNITTTSTSAYHHQILGNNNTVDSGGYVKILGSYCNNGGYTGVMLLSDGSSSTLTSTAHHQFSARFIGGYRFMKDGSTQWMAIANTGYVTINNIPTAASATDILVSNGGVVSTRTVASLGIGGSAVWKVQGGSTDATTNTQNIYHNANVWLGDGSGSSSSYRLHVSGISYFTGSMTLNNITSIQAWNNAASQQLKIAQLDSSNVFNYAENYLKIVGQGGNAGDITISAYPHTRKATLSAYPRNVLVTNSSGNLLSLQGESYKNDNVSTILSSDESHSADSTWRTVTWDLVNTPAWSQYGVDTTSGNMKMKLPTSTYEYGIHLIFVTLNYTGGTASEVNAEIRINGSTVIGSATTNATASKNTLTFFTVIDNAPYQGLVVSLHLMIATGTGSITLKAGSKMVMIAAGTLEDRD